MSWPEIELRSLGWQSDALTIENFVLLKNRYFGVIYPLSKRVGSVTWRGGGEAGQKSLREINKNNAKGSKGRNEGFEWGRRKVIIAKAVDPV